MADPEQSEADRMRAKRLARLGGGSTSSAPSTPSTSAAASSSAPAPVRASPTPAATPVPKPAAPKPAAARPSPAPSPAAPAKPAPAKKVAAAAAPTLPWDEWAQRTLLHVLGLSLGPPSAPGKVHLPSLVSELAAEHSGNAQLGADDVDRALLARLAAPGETFARADEGGMRIDEPVDGLLQGETTLSYLLGAWRRARSLGLRAAQTADPERRAKELELLADVKRRVLGYAGYALQDPGMWDDAARVNVGGRSTAVGTGEVVVALLGLEGPPGGLGAPDVPQLLKELAAAMAEDEGAYGGVQRAVVRDLGVKLILEGLDGSSEPASSAGVAGGLGSMLLGGSTGKTSRDYLEALRLLLLGQGGQGEAVLIKALVEDDEFLPEQVEGRTVKPQELELVSSLGPFLRVSTFPDSFPGIATRYFSDADTRGRGDLESAAQGLRASVAGIQNVQFQLLNSLVRSSPAARSRVLEYFATVGRQNVKRAAMQVDPRKVASTGFVVNLHVALLGFARPFLDPGMSKIGKIDPRYYQLCKNRIDVEEETKMHASKEEYEAFLSSSSASFENGPEPNFISEIFFLSSLFLHLGPLAAIREHKSLKRDASHWRRQVTEIEGDETWRGTPHEAAAQVQLERTKKKLREELSMIWAIETGLMDTEYARKVVEMGRAMMAWLVRMVDPRGEHPHRMVELPLPEETPDTFKYLPEYLIEDLTTYLTFASQYMPQVLAEGSQDDLMTFMLVFLSTPYVRNPYLKGQFVEIMYHLCQPTPRHQHGTLGEVLNFHKLALSNLMPCLIHAYIDIETTGSHTQFYDKFTTRYYITQLFKIVWENPAHRAALREETKSQFDRYVRFCNLLMNDVTYLLDDSLSLLAKISKIHQQQDDTAAWAALPATEKQEIEKNLRGWEGTVRNDLDLGTESLRLIHTFSSETVEPFLAPEIVDRLAAMLDFNLNMLAGPRCQDLRVREPEKLKFKPKELLSDVLAIFGVLGKHTQFREAVAKDGRSYSHDLFVRAEKIAIKTAMKGEAEIVALREMVKGVEEIRAREAEEEAMGDVPDEFLDPLTYELMRDPVLLPTSKTVVDRSTIKQHHLSDATDPFNRMPLKWEDITDAVDVREKIAAWQQERRAKVAAAVAAVPAVETVVEEDRMVEG